MDGPVLDEAAFVAEVLRIQERYLVEVVERFNVCPWARHARLSGDLVRTVLLQQDDDPAPTLALLDRLESAPAPPPVAIPVYPRLRLAPREFDAFAARVRKADQERHGGKPVYVAATFHPDYPLDDRSPSRLVPYFRRSPDPCLQLVRLKVIEEARGGDHGKFLFDFSPAGWEKLLRRTNTLSVTDRIGVDNQETLRREGVDAFEAIYRDIRDDRARTYARLGMP